MGMSIGGLIFHVINSLGLYKVARLKGIAYPWLAFIPMFNLYLVGIIGDSFKYTDFTVNKYLGNIPLSLTLPLMYMAGSMLGSIPLIGGLIYGIVNLAMMLLHLVVYYLIYKHYDYQNRMLFTALSIVPFAPTVLVLYVTRDYKLN